VIKLGFKDKRSKRLIWVCHCLLNQNVRFPGSAVSHGAIVEIIKPLLVKGIGIEQLPCPERKGWGGINRSKVFEWKGYENEDWITKYGDLCQKLAKDAVDEMEDAVKNGYSVLGIIAVDGSPTCGVNITCDVPEAWRKLFEATNGFTSIDMDKMYELGQKLYRDGAGQFMKRIEQEIKKRKLNISIVGFFPWNDFKIEQKNIFKKLGLPILR
jgi:predicted secreted protein